MEESGKMTTLRTREAINFDPKPRVLRGQKEVEEYLMTYVCLPLKIRVQWCSPEIDVIVPPPAGDVYFHPQILALRVKLSMTPFVRDALAHCKVPFL